MQTLTDSMVTIANHITGTVQWNSRAQKLKAKQGLLVIKGSPDETFMLN